MVGDMEETGRLPGAGRLAWLGEQFDHRQNESERLSGAGLRRGDEVFSSQGRLDGLRLNGGCFGETVSLEIVLQKSGQREIGKVFH